MTRLLLASTLAVGGCVAPDDPAQSTGSGLIAACTHVYYPEGGSHCIYLDGSADGSLDASDAGDGG